MIVPSRRRPSTFLFVLLLIASTIGLAGPAFAAPTPIVLGEPTRADLPRPDSVVEYSFTSTADDGQVRLRVDDVTVPSGVVVSIGGPNGASTSAVASGPTYLEIPVRGAGSWQISVAPYKFHSGHVPSPGSARLVVDLVHDEVATTTVGTPFTQTFDQPGVNADLTFEALAGQRLALDVTASHVSGTYDWYGVKVTLIGPEGSEPIALDRAFGDPAWLESAKSLGASGTWTLRLDPDFNATGAITARLRLLQEVSGGAVTVGTRTSVPFETSGNNVRVSFSGTAGRPLALEINDRDLTWRHAPDPVHVNAQVFRPDGSAFSALNPDGDWSETPPLDVTGTWTLLIDPVADATGSLGITLRQVAALKAALPLNRTATLSSTVRGQDTDLTFRAAPGRHLRLDITRQSWTSAQAGGAPSSGGAYLRFFRPDGSAASDQWLYYPGSDGAIVIDAPEPDVAGTWTVQVDPLEDAVGSLTGKATMVT